MVDVIAVSPAKIILGPGLLKPTAFMFFFLTNTEIYALLPMTDYRTKANQKSTWGKGATKRDLPVKG
jgi:hypothetical protein